MKYDDTCWISDVSLATRGGRWAKKRLTFMHVLSLRCLRILQVFYIINESRVPKTKMLHLFFVCLTKTRNKSSHLDLLWLMATVSLPIQVASSGRLIWWRIIDWWISWRWRHRKAVSVFLGRPGLWPEKIALFSTTSSDNKSAKY